jgi:hypothetical protein
VTVRKHPQYAFKEAFTAGRSAFGRRALVPCFVHCEVSFVTVFGDDLEAFRANRIVEPIRVWSVQERWTAWIRTVGVRHRHSPGSKFSESSLI